MGTTKGSVWLTRRADMSWWTRGAPLSPSSPQKTPKVISSSLGQLYNWPRGHRDDMERDNENIELQFVAGQWGPLEGHYRETRRLFERVQGPSVRVAAALFTVTAGMCVTAFQPPTCCSVSGGERRRGWYIESLVRKKGKLAAWWARHCG